VLQLYSLNFAPEEFYAKFGMTSDSTVHELLRKRSANFTRGLMESPKMFETVIPYWETDEDGKLTKLELLPVTIMKDTNKAQRGLPALSTDLSFIDRLAKMSAPYGTKIYMKDGVAVCEW
jgi:poly-gamma-glutamate synthesis protein (capsule biosynthesis protein)